MIALQFLKTIFSNIAVHISKLSMQMRLNKNTEYQYGQLGIRLQNITWDNEALNY